MHFGTTVDSPVQLPANSMPCRRQNCAASAGTNGISLIHQENTTCFTIQRIAKYYLRNNRITHIFILVACNCHAGDFSGRAIEYQYASYSALTRTMHRVSGAASSLRMHPRKNVRATEPPSTLKTRNLIPRIVICHPAGDTCLSSRHWTILYRQLCMLHMTH